MRIAIPVCYESFARDSKDVEGTYQIYTEAYLNKNYPRFHLKDIDFKSRQAIVERREDLEKSHT